MTPLSKDFKPLNSIDTLCKILKISSHGLKKILQNKDNFILTREKIIKGKKRLITFANGELEAIHICLNSYFLKGTKFPSFMHGGVKNKSQKTNVLYHKDSKFIFSSDIKDFFPSITRIMIKKSLIDHEAESETADFISNLCSFNDILPQGIHTSTYLANIVILPTAYRINKFCTKKGLKFSMLVDDITVSGDKELFPYYGTITGYVKQAGFQISKNKTDFSTNSKPKMVNKIVVNGKPRQSKKYITELKKDIRQLHTSDGNSKLINKYGKNITQIKTSIRGKLNYIRQYNPKIYREVRALLVKPDEK